MSAAVPENAMALSGQTVIVVPCHNERESVLRFLGSLGSIDPHAFQVVLVDDGSTDHVESAVHEAYPNTTVIRGDGNLWWSGAINAGIDAALVKNPAFVAFFNNDCVLPVGAIDALVRRSRQHPRTIVSATISDLDTGEPVSFGGRIGRSGLEYWETCPPRDADGLATVAWLPGHALVVPASIFAEVGRMDAATFPHYWGDSDFSLRARKAGYRLAVDPDVIVANDRGQTGVRLQERIRPRSLWTSLTSQRSWLRVRDNVTFWWRHRDVVQGRQMMRRYKPIPVALVVEVLERLHLRSFVRRVRHSE
jgi:GT2 family glycosyltransferase